MEWWKRLFSSKPQRPEDLDLERNQVCWCGSGKKYKTCHMEEDQREAAKKACSCSNFG